MINVTQKPQKSQKIQPAADVGCSGSLSVIEGDSASLTAFSAEWCARKGVVRENEGWRSWRCLRPRRHTNCGTHEILPFRVDCVDECNFLRTPHIFYLVLAFYCRHVIWEHFEIDAVLAVVFVRERTFVPVCPVLPRAPDDVGGASGIQHGVPFVRHDVGISWFHN